MAECVTEFYEEPYRQKLDFLVDRQLRHCRGSYDRGERKCLAEMLSVQRRSRRGQRSGTEGWQDCTRISRFNLFSALNTQYFYSSSPCCSTYRVSSELVFMRIFSRILAR